MSIRIFGSGGGVITDATATPDVVNPGYVFYNNNGRQVGSRTEFARKVVSFSFSIGDQCIKQLSSSERDAYACYSSLYGFLGSEGYGGFIGTDSDYWYNYNQIYGASDRNVNTIFKSISVLLDLTKQVLVNYIVTSSTSSGSDPLPLIFNVSIPHSLPDGYHCLKFFSDSNKYIKREFHLDVLFHVSSNIIDTIYLTDGSANIQTECLHSGTVTFRQCL